MNLYYPWMYLLYLLYLLYLMNLLCLLLHYPPLPLYFLQHLPLPLSPTSPSYSFTLLSFFSSPFSFFFFFCSSFLFQIPLCGPSLRMLQPRPRMELQLPRSRRDGVPQTRFPRDSLPPFSLILTPGCRRKFWTFCMRWTAWRTRMRSMSIWIISDSTWYDFHIWIISKKGQKKKKKKKKMAGKKFLHLGNLGNRFLFFFPWKT